MFFLWGGGKELFSIPYYNGTEKKVVFSTIYKVYYLQQSCPLSYYKEWENLAAKRTNHSFRDTEIPKGERHPRTPNLKPTAKPETSKLQDLALKGTGLGERNCKTTRTETAKVKQMYEVSEYLRQMKSSKKGVREKKHILMLAMKDNPERKQVKPIGLAGKK